MAKLMRGSSCALGSLVGLPALPMPILLRSWEYEASPLWLVPTLAQLGGDEEQEGPK